MGEEVGIKNCWIEGYGMINQSGICENQRSCEMGIIMRHFEVKVDYYICLKNLGNEMHGPAAETNFNVRSCTINSLKHKYQVFIPPGKSNTDKLPVILFLHGAGEKGTNGKKQVTVGIGPALVKYPEWYNTLVILPQCMPGYSWFDTEMIDLALTSLDKTINEFNCDTSRIYLTGISMGGYGTWELADKYPEKFAALMPICGGFRTHPHGRGKQQYEELVNKLSGTPIWIFHGEKDDIIPASESRVLYKYLKVKNPNVKYTEFKGVHHVSWDLVYQNKEYVDWLLKQRRENMAE